MAALLAQIDVRMTKLLAEIDATTKELAVHLPSSKKVIQMDSSTKKLKEDLPIKKSEKVARLLAQLHATTKILEGNLHGKIEELAQLETKPSGKRERVADITFGELEGERRGKRQKIVFVFESMLQEELRLRAFMNARIFEAQKIARQEDKEWAERVEATFQLRWAANEKAFAASIAKEAREIQQFMEAKTAEAERLEQLQQEIPKDCPKSLGKSSTKRYAIETSIACKCKRPRIHGTTLQAAGQTKQENEKQEVFGKTSKILEASLQIQKDLKGYHRLFLKHLPQVIAPHESTDDCIRRMDFYKGFYRAVIQCIIADGNEIHTSNNGWTWCARFMHIMPANIISATTLDVFLQVVGLTLRKIYPKQLVTLMNSLESNFIVNLKENGDKECNLVASRLETQCHKLLCL